MRHFLLTYARQLCTLLGLFLLCGVLALLTPYFLTVPNLLNVAQQTAINAIIAAGMTFVIISAGIDLSVGSILALAGVVLGGLLASQRSLPVALAAVLATGLACGLLNGVVIAFGRLPPLIAPLGVVRR